MIKLKITLCIWETVFVMSSFANCEDQDECISSGSTLFLKV